MRNDQETKPLYCSNCGESFLAKRFRVQIPQIVDFCRLESFRMELELLRKVKEMHRMFPESIGKMLPEWKIGNKDKPTAEEITLWTDGDINLQIFLFESSFNVDARTEFVQKEISALTLTVSPTFCPKCELGVVQFKKESFASYVPTLSRR